MDGHPRGGIGNIPLQFVLVCKLIDKGPKTDALYDTVYLQSPSHIILGHVRLSTHSDLRLINSVLHK